MQAVLAQIAWYHNVALIEKLWMERDRVWYAQATMEHGWSRNVLVHQIESRLYRVQVGSEEFFIDLLFYHLKLWAYVVVDLKTKELRPEFAGYGRPDVMKSGQKTH